MPSDLPDFSKMCTPALVYLTLSAIAVVLGILTKFNPITIAIKILFILIWAWILNFICEKGYKPVSWALVILPYIAMLGIFAMFFEAMKMKHTSN
jgi:hypothetical protein